MAHWSYTYSGLRVVAELYLPEWTPFEDSLPRSEPDVFIHVESQWPEALEPEENWSLINADHYRFSVPDVGRYWVRQGQEILVAPAPGAGAREIRLFLLGSAWGALCYQHGLFPLHASMIRIGNGVVAFCGAPGAGKSTLAAWLASRGYPLVVDDLCRVDLSVSEPPRVWPSTPRLKLWQEALSALGWSSEQLERDYFRADKFHLPWPEASLRQPLPLRAVYLLEWGETSLVRLTSTAALRRFIGSATYRGDLLEPMGRLAAHYAREVLGLSVYEGELLEARFPAEFFDVVLFPHTLEHMPFPLRELREAHRVLKKSGALVVMLPNAASPEARLFGPWWLAWDLPRHLYHFTPKTISALMAKAGFRVQRFVSASFLFNLFNLTASIGYLGKYKYGLSPVSRRFLIRACRPALILVAFLFALVKRSGEMTIIAVKA
jgi:SAM-dependent methyltransferase